MPCHFFLHCADDPYTINVFEDDVALLSMMEDGWGEGDCIGLLGAWKNIQYWSVSNLSSLVPLYLIFAGQTPH